MFDLNGDGKVDGTDLFLMEEFLDDDDDDNDKDGFDDDDDDDF